MKALSRVCAVTSVALLASSFSATSAFAGDLADIAGAVDFEGMKTDIKTVAPTLIGWIVAISALLFVIGLVRKTTRG